MDYEKPFKSIQAQIELLKSRGLIIDNEAEHYLRHLNYYRLSGYWIPFEQNHSGHSFAPNTHFNDVLNLYIFDRSLRLLLLDAIERVEVSVRTHWAYHCAEIGGPHAYLDDVLSRKQHWHQKNLQILQQEIDRSDETFIKHYRNKYSSPKEPPIWVVCEVMSLGLLSRWLKNLKPSQICTKIAKNYQIAYPVLTGFIEHLTYLRNLCAHHCRVWNRKFTKTMQISHTKPALLIHNFNFAPAKQRNIYNTLVMLIHFLNIISPDHHTTSRLINLLEKHVIRVEAMGFPNDWKQRDVWKGC